MKLILKFQSQGCQRFLRNIKIPLGLEKVTVSIFGIAYFSTVKLAHKISFLAIKGIWGMFTPRLLHNFFVKSIGEFYAYDLLAMLLKFYWLPFEKKFKSVAAIGSCHVTSSEQGVNKIL